MRQRNRILVIGDAMLDTYIYGGVNRVSPEAPVPVVRQSGENSCLGGAGNVARNAASLGAEVTALFAVGADESGEKVKQLLAAAGINCRMLLQDESLHTIRKMRIVGNGQQIARVDFHDGYQLSAKAADQLMASFRAAVDGQDIVAISDYGKGTCSERVCREVIALCRERSIPVIVDPKGTQWEKYRGASIITPNVKELNAYSGQDVPNDSRAVEDAYRDLPGKLGVDYLLLTRSEHGMSLIGRTDLRHIAAECREVYDVSGAGDTVVAALAAFLGPGAANILEAVHLANTAAGIVVAKPGTAVATLREIREKTPRARYAARIFTLDEYDSLAETVSSWRNAGDRIVTTNGCFDILHRGHVKLLEQARGLGDRLIVAVNSDASVRRLKGGGRPINGERDRAFVLSALRAVDAVVIFDPKKTPYTLAPGERALLSDRALAAAAEAPMALMRLIQADTHVKGGDYREGDVPEAVFASRLALIPLEEGYSTTNMIGKVFGKE